MQQNDNYRYRITKVHSVLVDFDGDIDRTNVPGQLEGRETFKHWTRRVLGAAASNVTVLVPITPAPGTQMRTLRELAGADSVTRMFNAMDRDNKAHQKVAVRGAVVETAHQLTSFPRQDLEDILEELDTDLESSVKEFFVHFLGETEADIEFDDLLRKLIATYNSAVACARRVNKA